MRQLKFHEKKLLRKVDFLQWKNENNQRELQVKPALDLQPIRSLGGSDWLCPAAHEEPSSSYMAQYLYKSAK